MNRILVMAAGLAVASGSFLAYAQTPTPGYSERVLQWTVQEGETCADIALSLYGHVRHVPLLGRYNAVNCAAGLAAGTTLVVPEQVTELPTATLRSMAPDVRSRPPAGAWVPASPGMPLHRRYGVNTMDTGRADIRFMDRTRVFLAENTLVVIFGTAGQTQVTKTPPARVRLDEGEVQAGLSALRGDAVEVDVEGGARVSANSRDTIVKKKVERTTVSVFDGSAAVRSGGSKVDVPARMGTSFFRAKPPTPPRPLPPAPVWSEPSSKGVLLASANTGTLRAVWSEVPNARSYRFEVSRDADFTDLVVREEIPKDIRAFRAERMPAGAYYLRVRALDEEDFVGIASAAREVVLLDVALKESATGEVRPDELVLHPYAVLSFEPDSQLEMALDDGPFGPVISSLDLRKQAPKQIQLRKRGAEDAQVVTVRYVETSATIRPLGKVQGGAVPLRIALHGFDGVDVDRRVSPKLRVHRGGEVATLALVASAQDPMAYEASVVVESGDEAQVYVVDSRGRVLGSETLRVEGQAKPTAEKKPSSPAVTAAPWVLSEAVGMGWWGPGATSSGHVGAAVALQEKEPVGQLTMAALGRHENFALEARVASEALAEDGAADGAAWAGLRWTALDYLPEGRIAVEPSLRVGVPMSDGGPHARLEPAVAIGSLFDRWTWAVDMGVRKRIEGGEERTAVPDVQAFVLLGGTYDANAWLRLFGVMDGHVMDSDGWLGRAGFGFGAETQGVVFGSLGVHASPWHDAGGIVSGHLSVGVRDD